MADLTFKLGGIEEQLKKSREAQAKSEQAASDAERRVKDVSFKASRVPALEMEVTALRPQLEEARRRTKELKAEVTKIRQEREQLAAAVEIGTARTAELERRLQTLSAEASRAAEEHRRQLEESRRRAAEGQRFQESLEQELGKARQGEDDARAEAAARRTAEERLRAAVTELEGIRQTQQGSLDRLRPKVKELEEALAAALSRSRDLPAPSVSVPAPPVDVSAPVPIPESLPSRTAPEAPPAAGPDVPPLPAAPEAAPRPAEPAPQVAVRPMAEAPVPSKPPPRAQDLFGPEGEDGQPRYALEDVLAKDTLGVVYRACERSTGRSFMVRFMAGQAGEEQTQAIERGVEKLIALPHPHILRVQGSGRRKNRLYLMMDLVDGPTLGQAKIHEIPRVCAIIRDAASAVHYAHEEGIFHGDLNLETILVAQREGKDHALLKEFGLGFLQEIMLAPPSGKESPSFLRDPAYLPPEQVRATKSPLGAAGDVYGLAATLYAALAGHPPFEGSDPAKVAKRVMIEEPLPVEKLRLDVPEAVGSIIRRGMAKDRDLRFASAQDMSEALTRFLGTQKS